MIEIKARLKVPRSAYKVDIRGRLVLAFEQRATSGLLAKLESGEEVMLNLPRGELLRGGDLVTASDGRVIEIVALEEPLFHIEGAALTALAYHLGLHQVPVQVGKDFLRVPADRALEDAARKLGAQVTQVKAPFEAEAGPAADHGHVHDEHCGHDHHGHSHHHYESK